MSPRASVIDMFGSSVPIWIFASLAGLGVALALREGMILAGWQQDLPLPAVFYVAVALIAGILIHLVWIGGYR